MAEAAAVQDAQHHADVQITSVEARVDTTTTGGKQTVYGVDTTDGRFGCLDDKMAADLRQLAGVPGHAVRLFYDETKRGNLIVGIDEVPF